MVQYKTLRAACWILLSVLIISCGKGKELDAEDYMKFRLIAWNSIETGTREIITHEWKDAEVSRIRNPDNEKEDVMLVDFHTPYENLTCPIYVYVDIKTEEVFYPKNVLVCDAL
jgi:hypothetical protein